MLKEIVKNRIYYLVLLTGLVLGLVAFFGLFGMPNLRIEAVIGLCAFYFFWGVGHHLLEHDLHFKVVLEYFLVASIACIVLLSLIWRA
jgi:hypothetical protein